MVRPRVYITVPNGDGLLHKRVMFAAVRLLQDRRFEIRFAAPTHRPFENNLHHCLVDFLNGGEDFWLTIDSDNPPLGNPLDRIADDLDVCGFPTPVYHNTGNGERPWYFNAYRRSSDEAGYNEWNVQSGLQQVDAVGTGCLLVNRRVFDDPVMRQAPFQRRFDVEGRVVVGNDIAFCERAKSCGFEVWCDFDRPCQHFVDNVELIELIGSIQKMNQG